MSSLTRRAWLKKCLESGVAPLMIAHPLRGHAAPSNRITMGLIGMGLMMKGHLRAMCGRPDVQVLAVCDVDRGRRESARQAVEAAYGAQRASGSWHGCEAVNEFERILARDDIQAVLIATPDHWHAPIACAAIRAGKDVYVEKPMTLTQREGRVLSQLARQCGAIVQVGTQQRSENAFRRACEIVRNGWIGRVHTIYARLGEFPPPVELPEEPIPDGFDYDRWLGPTPWRPYNAERVKGDYGGGWRRFWEYGSRKNGDWGAHHFDIIQWALGMDDSGPIEFIPKGWEGTEFQTHVYANGVRVLRDHPTRDGHMIQFIGTEGEVCVSRGNRLDTIPAALAERTPGPNEIRLYESANHHDNWIECIRTRRPTICPPEVGHRSATICILAGIAERLGRPIRWDPVREDIVGDEAARRWLDRPRRAPYLML
ncbi:MAG: Gfo/Idh/MocA family oxidoreductase [Kiritimatiellae bacterium]|nr:Gfo/Idh/MocA family oxidoreductase [Kiritimatiellia bacterium]